MTLEGCRKNCSIVIKVVLDVLILILGNPVFIGYWICIRKYWVTWLEISVRACEHRYQTKEPNIFFVYRFNNLIIICGMQVYHNWATLFIEKPVNNPQNASQNNGNNITIQYGWILYSRAPIKIHSEMYTTYNRYM